MIKNQDKIWEQNMPQQLALVLSDVGGYDDMQKVLRDLLTEKEIIEISARLEAAWMLSNGEKYTDITAKTKLSSRTVARISDWYKNGSNGYKLVMPIISNHHQHIPPARTE